jgi:hypothetical protein
MMRRRASIVRQIAQTVDFAHTPWFDRSARTDGMSPFTLEDRKRDASAMTVGIAVLCGGGKAVVVASDRMVSTDIGGHHGTDGC